MLLGLILNGTPQAHPGAIRHLRIEARWRLNLILEKRGLARLPWLWKTIPGYGGLFHPLSCPMVLGPAVRRENGREGIELAKRLKPDVIVLDLSMPIMNGLEAATELRKILPKVPIILFTLYGDSVSKTEASRAGVNAVLLKTDPLPTLIDVARELMRSSR